MNWMDPFVLMAALPCRPRLYFFGPKEEDMAVGGRNRLMRWTGTTSRTSRARTTCSRRRAGSSAVARERRRPRDRGGGPDPCRREPTRCRSGGAGVLRAAVRCAARPGRDQRHELAALRRPGPGAVGEPIEVAGRPRREAVDAADRALWTALHALVADGPDFAAARAGSDGG